MARSGVSYIIDEVRRLSGAGTAEFVVGTISYFSDDTIERILDTRRARLSRHEVVFEPELSTDGSGSAVYRHAKIGYGWVEDDSTGTANFIVTNSSGSIYGTAAYTFSPEDGFLTFSSNQKGSQVFVTGWVHNPYQAAMDVLVSWNTQIAFQPDWETDNMKVKRSQRVGAIQAQIKNLKELGGWSPALRSTKIARTDLDDGN